MIHPEAMADLHEPLCLLMVILGISDTVKQNLDLGW
jgi:hypothetical protein